MSIGYNSVYFATNTPIFPSVTGLRTFKNYQDGMMVFTSGNKTQSDQEGAGYTFDSSSTLADDGYFVIKPTAIDNNSAGRWVIVNANSINKNIVSTGYLNLDSGNFTSDGKGNLKAVSLTLNGSTVPTNRDVAAKYATITSLNSEVTRAQQAETTLQSNIDNEIKRAESAETNLQNVSNTKANLNIPNTFTGDQTITGNINASGNIVSQQSFICTGYAELVAGNNTANKLEVTSEGILNLYSNNVNIFNVSDTKATINGSLSTDNGKITTDGLGNMSITGNLKVPTVATTDNSQNAASTAFVNNLFGSLQKTVNGDISKTGDSINVTIPNENILVTLTSTSSTSANISYQAISGSISPVDIRRCTIWGSAGVESYTLDGGTLTTTPVIADDTIYTQSNDTSIYFIRVNGNIYIITVWISGNGARASMIYRQLI